MINRAYQPLDQHVEKGKVLVIYGPRQVGKTTLTEFFLSHTKLKYKLDSGDNLRVQEIMGSSRFDLIIEYLKGYELYVLDEAQNVPEIGKGLKIIVDQIPWISVIATGSSSFDLSNRIGEPLVGRQKVLKLFPISLMELLKEQNKVELDFKLEDFVIFGMYPEVVTQNDKLRKTEYLRELVNSYMLKDILTLENVKSPRVLMDLLRMLSYQVGSEVSLNEISNALRIDVKTVQRYLDLLEKSFVIISIGGYSRNLRNEITSKKKYYFIDVGVRNAIINSFNPIATRNDMGALWENFVVMERLKKKTYQRLYSNDYFWRTYAGKEIDLVEERDGKLFAYELKWTPGKFRIPKDWAAAYPDSEFKYISRDNYFDFVV